MNYQFHPEAERELDEATFRYALDVPGLGRRLLDEVERVVEVLLRHPDIGARIDDDLRHFVLRKLWYTERRPISFTSSLSRTAAENPDTGAHEFTIVDRAEAVELVAPRQLWSEGSRV